MVDRRRARRARIVHPRKRFGQRSIDYRHYLPELARKPQAVRQVLPDLLRDLGAPFPAVVGSLSGGASAPRGRPALCEGARAARHARLRAWCRRWMAHSATGTPVLLALTPADGTRASRARRGPRRVTRSGGAQWLRRRLRRLAGGGRMSAATLTRDLVVTHTRALKLPGVARVFESLARQARRCALAARRLSPGGAQRGAGLTTRVGDPSAAPRGALSRSENPRHV